MVKNKLVRVKPITLDGDTDHPLYALHKKVDELDHEDMDRVYQFFEDMIVPEGFYALVNHDPYGYWIEFYQGVLD